MKKDAAMKLQMKITIARNETWSQIQQLNITTFIMIYLV